MQSAKIPAVGNARRTARSDWLYWLAAPFLALGALLDFARAKPWDW